MKLCFPMFESINSRLGSGPWRFVIPPLVVLDYLGILIAPSVLMGLPALIARSQPVGSLASNAALGVALALLAGAGALPVRNVVRYRRATGWILFDHCVMVAGCVLGAGAAVFVTFAAR